MLHRLGRAAGRAGAQSARGATSARARRSGRTTPPGQLTLQRASSRCRSPAGQRPGQERRKRRRTNHVRNRRRGRARNVVPILIEGTAAPGIPRLRLVRRRGAQRRRCSGWSAPRAWPTGRASASRTHHRRRTPASPTRAGRRTARRVTPTRIRTSRAARSRVVHNGIIENHESCARELQAQGLRVRVADRHRSHRAPDPQRMYRRRPAATRCSDAVAELHGAYAIAVVQQARAATAWSARAPGCPLVVGWAKARTSSPPMRSALVGARDRIVYLEEGDVAEIGLGRRARCSIATARTVEREVVHVSRASGDAVELGPVPATSCRRKSSSSRARSPTRWRAIGAHRAGAVRRRRGASAARRRRRADPRLRHQLLRRPGRAVLARSRSPAAVPGRDRERIPLPRQRARSEARWSS